FLAIAVLATMIVPWSTRASTQRHRPALEARLVDAVKRAEAGTASVEVTVSGVDLVEPVSATSAPEAGKGPLPHEIDGGRVITTSVRRLSFHNLASGPHSIVVALVTGDPGSRSAECALPVTIP